MTDYSTNPNPIEYGRVVGQLIADSLDAAKARTSEPYRPVAEDDDED